VRLSRYRFEVVAAYFLGVALPVLEVCRRRTDFSDIPGYIDDFIVGALLLFAARSATRERPYSRTLLAAAWGILCGGLWSSFFGQLYSTSPNDISGLPNSVVVFLKLLVYGIAVICLVLSVRRSDT
jgi:hypothetical protein